MGLFENFKIRKALLLHQNGDKRGALKLYEEFYSNGTILSSYLLPYSLLLIKAGNFDKAIEVLKKAENAKDLRPEGRRQIMSNYSVCLYKKGFLDKAIEVLERVHEKTPCGLIYQTLGYLYIEQGDKERALRFNLEALEYDDEDSVILDNLGQIYYRLFEDKEKAREYFQRAISIKKAQIDTLYFLALYDIEAGKKDEAIEKLEIAEEGSFSPLNYVSKKMVQEKLEELRQQ